MKKIFITVLALCTVLSACGQKNAEENKSVTETTLTSVVTIPMKENTDPSGTEETTEEIVPVINPEDTFVTEKANPEYGDGVDVEYDVITVGNADVDELIASAAAAELKRCIPNASSIEELGGTAEYDVKLSGIYRNDVIVSAVFSGRYAIHYETREDGGEVAYTVNIDPVTGKLLETSDIVDYEKMVEAFENGNFDVKPDFSQYKPDYGIYPHVSLEEIDGELKLGLYINENDMESKVYGYYIALDSAKDFLKIQIGAEE